MVASLKLGGFLSVQVFGPEETKTVWFLLSWANLPTRIMAGSYLVLKPACPGTRLLRALSVAFPLGVRLPGPGRGA
jgi:hypothetical protein